MNQARAQLLIPPDVTGITSEVEDAIGVTFGVYGISNSTDDGSSGVVGESSTAAGATRGVVGRVQSAAGVAGVFDNAAGGKILSGLSGAGAVEVFDVDGAGLVTASGFSGDGSSLTGVTADDADTLDALDSLQFLRSDQSDSLTLGTLATSAGTIVDIDGAMDASGATSLTLPAGGISGAGSGSGLDADTLDGADSATYVQALGTTQISSSGAGEICVTCPGSHPLMTGGACEKAGGGGPGFGASSTISATTYCCEDPGAGNNVSVTAVCARVQ